MTEEIINVTLPEWAWLAGSDHDKTTHTLDARNVILHVRSASVIEFFEEHNFMPKSDNIQSFSFPYKDLNGDESWHVAVLHYSAVTEDEDVIRQILEKAAKWYCDYMRYDEHDMINARTSMLN